MAGVCPAGIPPKVHLSFLLRAPYANASVEGFERTSAGVVDPAENRSTGDRKGRGPARIKSAVGAWRMHRCDASDKTLRPGLRARR